MSELSAFLVAVAVVVGGLAAGYLFARYQRKDKYVSTKDEAPENVAEYRIVESHLGDRFTIQYWSPELLGWHSWDQATYGSREAAEHILRLTVKPPEEVAVYYDADGKKTTNTTRVMTE